MQAAWFIRDDAIQYGLAPMISDQRRQTGGVDIANLTRSGPGVGANDFVAGGYDANARFSANLNFQDAQRGEPPDLCRSNLAAGCEDNLPGSNIFASPDDVFPGSKGPEDFDFS
jgi:hypothetical protein